MKFYKSAARILTLTLVAGAFASTAWAASSMSQPGEHINEQLPVGSAAVENNSTVQNANVPEVKFTLKSIKLDAAELHLNQAELAKILQGCLNREMTLAEFNQEIDKVTAFCRQHGYPASAAYLPAQDSTDGSVTIKVIPGRYGKVSIENHSRLEEDIVQGFINNLKSGEIIRADKLETALYGISDLSGTKAVAVLSPGADFGTSDLTVRVEDGKQSNTVLYAENYGSKSSGRYRYGIQESLYNVGGRGNKLNVGGLVSNSNLRNYYVNYEALVGRGGTTLGLGISRMQYMIGGVLGNSGMHGNADTLSLFGSAPIYHLTDRKLTFKYGFDYRKLKDDYDNGFWSSMLARKKHSTSVHAGVEGFQRFDGSVVNYDATVTTGRMNLESDSLVGKSLDEMTKADGSFTKLNASVTGVQSLGHKTDFMVKISGQQASHNLDSSEQFYLGGANGVRAYPQGEGSGDAGLQGTAELRYYTDVPGLVLSTYFDMGHVKFHHDGTEDIGGTSGETLKGWGIGISYTKPNDWFARFDYARRIGGPSYMSHDARSKARMWFILGKIW